MNKRLVLVAAVLVGTLGVSSVVGASPPSAKSRLISVRELPAGWHRTSIPPVSGSRRGCLPPWAVSGVPYRGAWVNFSGGGALSLDEGLAPRSPAEVGAFRVVRQRYGECQTHSMHAAVGTGPYAVRKLSFPPLGADAEAFNVTGTITGVAAAMDIVLFSTRRFDGALGYVNVKTPKVQALEEFTREAIRKAEGQTTKASLVAACRGVVVPSEQEANRNTELAVRVSEVHALEQSGNRVLERVGVSIADVGGHRRDEAMVVRDLLLRASDTCRVLGLSTGA